MVGVVETHVDPETARLLFFNKLQHGDAAADGTGGMVENQFFYQWGLVIGCKKKWAEKHKVRQVKVTKKRGVLVLVSSE